MQEQHRIRPVAYGLALYLLMSVFDALNIAGIGSILKLVAFIPLGLMVLQFRELRICCNLLSLSQIAFLLLAFSSLTYTIAFERTLSAVMTLTLNLMLVFMLGSMVPYNRAEIELLQRAMLWSGWVQIIFTLLFADVSAAGRLTLRFGESVQDQNNNNTFFLYAFSYHCYNFLCNRKKKHIVPVLIMVTMVLLSGSRGALLAFALTFFFHICVFFKESKHAIRNILVAAALLILSGVFFKLILAQLPESVSVRFSWDYLAEKGTTGRGRTWAYLWEQFLSSNTLRMLFGHGYGTTSIVNQLNHNVAHNLYLDNLITLGIVGVFLQIASQGAVVRIFHKNKKYALLGAYLGMITMCMSLSLTASKPLWNMMLIALAIHCNSRE